MPAYRVIFRREVMIYVAGVDRPTIKWAADTMADEDVESIAGVRSWHREVHGHGVLPQLADHIIVAGKIVRIDTVREGRCAVSDKRIPFAVSTDNHGRLSGYVTIDNARALRDALTAALDAVVAPPTTIGPLRDAVAALLAAHDAVMAYRGTVPEVCDVLAERRLMALDDLRAVFEGGATIARSATVAEDHVTDCNTCPYSMEFAGGRWRCVHTDTIEANFDKGKRVELHEDDTPPPEWCPLRKGPTLVTLRLDAHDAQEKGGGA